MLFYIIQQMNQDIITYVSCFLLPTDIQNMALINREYAASIRYAYQGPIQREPIRLWNHIRKQFYTEQIGDMKWIRMDMDMFPYLDHVETMFDMIIEKGVDNLFIHSSNMYLPTEQQFHRFVHQVITRKHRLGTITIPLIKITDSMYNHFIQSLQPVIHGMKLLYIACNGGRMINRETYS